MEKQDFVWILWWRIGSAVKLVRAYLDEARANEDHKLVLDVATDRIWILSKVVCGYFCTPDDYLRGFDDD